MPSNNDPLVMGLDPETGAPFTDYDEVSIDARMPAHKHGMLRDVGLTPQEDGSMRADGLLLHMYGHWELHVDIRKGARFERAISTAGITPMSHSSILTGLNNYKHGMRVFFSEEVSHRLKDSVDTLPELLAARGRGRGKGPHRPCPGGREEAGARS